MPDRTGAPRVVAILVGLSVVAPAGVVALDELAGGLALLVPLAAVGFLAYLVLRHGAPQARSWLALGLGLLGLGACAMPFVPPWICGGMATALGVAALLAARFGRGPFIVWAALTGFSALVVGGALLVGMFSGHLIDLAERRAPVLLGAMALVPVAAVGFLFAAWLHVLAQLTGSD